MVLTANAFATDRHNLIIQNLPDPAAANALLYPVPDNQVMQIVGIRLQLVTSAVVADRRVFVELVDDLGANPIQTSTACIVQAANLTYTYNFTCGVAPVDATADSLRVYAPLACGLQLFDADQLTISATNLAAGDQIQNVRLRYYEWKED